MTALPPPPVVLRERRPADRDALVEILTEQQPGSRYPFRWPLPMPVHDFVYRPDDELSWVAQAAGLVAGHVSVGRVSDDDGAVFTRALGVPAHRLRLVSTLFTSTAARGCGVGSALLTRAERHIIALGCVPVLDVVPAHAVALALYRRRGWREIARGRPEWLPADAPDVLYLALAQASHGRGEGMPLA